MHNARERMEGDNRLRTVNESDLKLHHVDDEGIKMFECPLGSGSMVKEGNDVCKKCGVTIVWKNATWHPTTWWMPAPQPT